MSHHCPKCDVNWWPYEAKGGVCPRCGGGTRQVLADGDPGRVRLRDSSSRQLADLEALAKLPTVEPSGMRRSRTAAS